jgi:tetratricopeptide (TPR) repeat protein
MRSIAVLVVALGCAGAVGATPESARAQQKHTRKLDAKTAEAKRHFDEGAEAFKQGDYPKAIAAWETSYELSKEPLLFEDLANAYYHLDNPKKERECLAKWREAAPKEEWALLDERLRTLDERIARDDEAARRMDEAKRANEARARAAKASRNKAVLGYALVGSGVAFVAAGVALDLVAASRRPNVSTACQSLGDLHICRDSVESAIRKSNTLAITGDVLWIAGTVATVGGAGLVVWGRSTREKTAPSPANGATSAAWLVPFAAPAGGGLALTGRM